MGFGQRLDLKQSQQLVMTPQLQQAIKMLQMSNLELTAFVEQELERNPLLERAEASGGEPDDRIGDAADRMDVSSPAQSDSGPGEGADRLDTALADDRLGRADDVFDTGAENLYADQTPADRDALSGGPDPLIDGPGGLAEQEGAAWAQLGRGGGGGFDEMDSSLEARASSPVTLREHLLAQLGQTAIASPAIRLIAVDLIEALDEAGYLQANLDEVAERLGADRADVGQALEIIHSFDPTGVGARSLRECLGLQLAERSRLDPAMATLLEHLELLAACKMTRLRNLCGVDDEDLREMIAELRALDPKPGLRFATDVTQTVSPDVFVFEARDGSWRVELNSDTLPRVLVNSTYAAQVMRSTRRGARDGDRNREVKEYLLERQQTANWLVKSIDQRAKTILRVASEIVRQQDGFFVDGVMALRPLNLKQVADAIEMHESTVSRVTSNKFVGTPRGIFELKYFFTPAISSTDGGEAYSAETIRHRIKNLIDNEQADAVLSDDRIVTILRDAGVDIARRTVTKYREALGIPSSIKRRRVLAAAR